MVVFCYHIHEEDPFCLFSDYIVKVLFFFFKHFFSNFFYLFLLPLNILLCHFVNKVYPNLDIDFLDTSVIDKAKKMAIARNQNHAWKGMSNEELLRSANLILTDTETKREGITLAAILLFGKDNSIMSVLP